MNVKPYSPQDAIAICRDVSEWPGAQLNQSSGIAFTAFDDNDKPVFAGGVRTVGVGEAWFLMKPEDREELSSGRPNAEKIQMVKIVRQSLDNIIRSESLWRIFAEARKSKRFMNTMGFVESDTLIWKPS